MIINSAMQINPKTHFIADRRIYLDAEGKVVEADDPKRATLIAAEGQGIPLARARQLGLVDGKEKASEAKASEEKAGKKASNKAAPKAENKST